MNTKFTMLLAAGLLFAGVSQAQGTDATAFNKAPHHAKVGNHQKQVQSKHHRQHKKVQHKKKHHKKMHHSRSNHQ